MKVSHSIDELACNRVLNDPGRLVALEETHQLNSNRIEALDRIARLASKTLNVPLTIVSLISNTEHHFKSFYGLPEPWASNPVIPIDNSVCRYSLSGDVLSLTDVRDAPLLASNPAVPALNLVAYLGVPLIDPEGHNLGAFCAIEYQPRTWSESDVEILKDLTSIVMSELHLQKNLENLQNALKDRDKAIALVAHDLRSPIAAIRGFADLMSADDDKEFHSEAIDAIRRLADKSIQTMESYLDQTTSERGEKDLVPHRFNPHTILVDLITELELIHGKVFDLVCSDRVSDIQFNQQDFIRTIENLAGNAVKYGKFGGRVKIEIEQKEMSEVRVAVQNLGNPINASEIDQILTANSRTQRARESGTKGWGLGLEFVKKVVGENSSKLAIQSSLESGTIFEIIMPV